MSTDSIEAPVLVERDDYNNANLRTFEVTWENGNVEQIDAHWILHPFKGIDSRPSNEHITLTGWYDGTHRIALSVRPDRIRCIRDLGVLSPLPDLDPALPDEPTEAVIDESAGDEASL